MSVVLVDDTLGSLDMRCDPFVVMGLDVSAPAVRTVMRNRALADGGYDDTRFTGARAFTLTLRLKAGARCAPYTIQGLIDTLSPFTHPRRRLDLVWSLPGSDGVVRRARVRGEGLPFSIEGPKYPVVVAQFVSADGEITSATGGTEGNGRSCQLIEPSEDTEAGRVYDLEYDRVYPPSAGIGDRIVRNNGNEDAHWTATIFGAATVPHLRVNGQTISFSEQGGLVLSGGESVEINTRERTILLNGDPTEPRTQFTNFTQWSWSDLLLKPGDNFIRYTADVLGVGTRANFCWYDTWLG